MNKEDLEEKLIKMGVNPINFTLDNNLKLDSIVLQFRYSKWEVYYIDERSGKNKMGKFISENDACVYILETFKLSKELDIKRKLNK